MALITEQSPRGPRKGKPLGSNHLSIKSLYLPDTPASTHQAPTLYVTTLFLKALPLTLHPSLPCCWLHSPQFSRDWFFPSEMPDSWGPSDPSWLWFLSLGEITSFFLRFKKKFIYFYWLCWVFVAAHRLSLVAARGATLRCGAWASPCCGFSCCRAGL